MEEKEYREMVIKLRLHQDAWFRLHKPSDLHEAKRLEKLIDAENRRWLEESKTIPPKQTTLFE